MNAIDDKKQDRALLVAELQRAGATFRGKQFRCLFPENHKNGDQHFSAGIFEAANGFFRWKCLGCGASGDVFDVIAHNEGRAAADVMRAVKSESRAAGGNRPGAQAGRSAAAKPAKVYPDIDAMLRNLPGTKKTYSYCDLPGAVCLLVVRCDLPDGSKTFRQISPANGGYCWGGAAAKPWPLYNAELIQTSDRVVICEGEKCCDALAYFGFDATTTAGGAKNAGSSDLSPLGEKTIFIWPDADDAGAKYADDICDLVFDLPKPPAAVWRIDPETIGLTEPGADAADFCRRLFDRGLDRDAIRAEIEGVISRAENVVRDGGAVALERLFDAIGAGKMRPVKTNFPETDRLVCFDPGSLNLLCGSGGGKKSFLSIQLLRVWYDAGLPAAYYALEKDVCFHLRRGLAQEAQNALLTNNDWCELHFQEVQSVLRDYYNFYHGFEKLIYADPDKIISQADVIRFLQAKIESGIRALIVDPVTFAARDDVPWVADGHFIKSIQRLVTKSGATVFLVCHPIKGVIDYPDLSMIAGAKDFGNFADNALWISGHDSKLSDIAYCTGTAAGRHNATVSILKSRSGAGMGQKIAFEFDPLSLEFCELGRIKKQAKEGKI